MTDTDWPDRNHAIRTAVLAGMSMMRAREYNSNSLVAASLGDEESATAWARIAGECRGTAMAWLLEIGGE